MKNGGREKLRQNKRDNARTIVRYQHERNEFEVAVKRETWGERGRERKRVTEKESCLLCRHKL